MAGDLQIRLCLDAGVSLTTRLRNPNIRSGREVEAGRHYADNREGPAVDPQSSADDSGIAFDHLLYNRWLSTTTEALALSCSAGRIKRPTNG